VADLTTLFDLGQGIGIRIFEVPAADQGSLHRNFADFTLGDRQIITPAFDGIVTDPYNSSVDIVNRPSDADPVAFFTELAGFCQNFPASNRYNRDCLRRPIGV
jgi:hypothetical protein